MDFFLKQLNSKRDQLRHLEKQVLDYMIQNPEDVLTMNIEKLAQAVYVSTATVSRACKQLGYRGFQDLKFSLSKSRNVRERKEKSEIVHLSSHITRMTVEWNQTLELINEADISRAVKIIKASQQVEFFGMGASYPTCVEAARKFMFAGCMCTARADWDTLYHLAQNLTADDLAIIVSSSGETNRIIELARTLKSNETTIISIVGHDHSTLEGISDLTLRGSVEACYYGEIDMTSRFLLSIILDLLVLTYMHQN